MQNKKGNSRKKNSSKNGSLPIQLTGFTRLEENYKEYIDTTGKFKFWYPKNWFVQESIWDTDVRAVITTSPEGFFWLVASYPEETDFDTTAKGVLEMMQGEYKDAEIAPARRMIAGRMLKGYEIDFFFLDFVNFASVFGVKESGRTWIFYQQGTEHLTLGGEEVSAEEVFTAITYSFLEKLTEIREEGQISRGSLVPPKTEAASEENSADDKADA